MKILAYYLPQFHEIEENNRWWGKGFTEWTNVKKAIPLFEGHLQPKKPEDDNYYNLLDKKTMEWQLKLSERYGIYGFCYYHYWFKGKKILEKPIENLLEWKDINQKFCFCWANHDWRKTWDGTVELLLKQEYGEKKDWLIHINYLLKFFKDKRYIKKENKPIFVIYKASDIENCNEMIDIWDKECKNHGFDGIYIIESLDSKSSKITCSNSNGAVFREPSIALSKIRKIPKYKKILNKIFNLKKEKKLEKIDYDDVWIEILKNAKNKITGKENYLGAFSFWDNTPRHGKNGFTIECDDLKKFKRYMTELYKIGKEKEIEYLFFNAWNEWGEGMYLEPDKERQILKYIPEEYKIEVFKEKDIK